MRRGEALYEEEEALKRLLDFACPRCGAELEHYASEGEEFDCPDCQLEFEARQGRALYCETEVIPPAPDDVSRERRSAGTGSALRIAVLSDLHIDSEMSPASWEHAMAAIRRAADERVDHLLLCGDTFDSSIALRNDAPRLQGFLHSLGFWHPDRLSIAPGNHDIFPIGHDRKSSLPFWEGRFFLDWAAATVRSGQSIYRNALYPFCKDLGGAQLVVADSVPADWMQSSNGHWHADDDDALRARLEGWRGHILVALHHPPHRSNEMTRGLGASVLSRLQRGELAAVYPTVKAPRGLFSEDLERFESFLEDLDVRAVFCGHVHVGLTRSWRLGATPVFLEGRTNGYARTRAFGVASLSGRGHATYRTVRL